MGDYRNENSTSNFRWIRNLNKKNILIYSLVIIFALFLFRNLFFKDYNSETKSYLQSMGRSDAIDRIIPKTSEDFIKEKRMKELQIDSIVKNITQLQEDFKFLRQEMKKISDSKPLGN